MKLRHIVLLGLLGLGACSEPPPPPPPVEVVVDRAVELPYIPQQSFVGRLEAENDVHLRAKVTGYLEDRFFQEGDLVKEGDELYRIDTAQFEAELAQARAQLAKATASVDVAERNFRRGKELLPKGAISESEFDQLTAKKYQADADLRLAEAQVKAAEVNLSYTSIKAPISGRIGRSEYYHGDLIGPDSGTLTTLVSIDPMKALFQVSERAFLATDSRRREMDEQGIDLPQLSVKVELGNGEVYPEVGYIDYISNRVDGSTGTIEARASMPNPDGELLPGQYVKVLIELPQAIDTLMVPQAAVQADQQGDFVLIVDIDNKVQRRNLDLNDRVGDKVVVKTGLEVGEQVIVRGLQKVRPGQTVRVKQMPSAKAEG